MRHLRVRKQLGYVIASALAAVPACGTGASDASSSGLGDGMTSMCKDGKAPLLPGLAPGQPVDFLAVRTESMPYVPVVASDAGAGDAGAGDAGAPATSWTATLSDQVGAPCTAASDKVRCEAALRDLRRYTECLGQSQGNAGLRDCAWGYLVYTRGDEVGFVAESTEALAAFLAPIDTPEEAAAIVARTGRYLSCTDDPKLAYRAGARGFEVLVGAGGSCGHPPASSEIVVRVTTDGHLEDVATRQIRELTPCAEGRRHEGLTSIPCVSRQAPALGAYFARAAHLEAAAALAFEHLEKELAALDAPADLQRAVRRARGDELRHARQVGLLAERFGTPACPAHARPMALRSAYAIALENAKEGCVRETFGAAVAALRAERAEDPAVRDVAKRIAGDELRHAELAWCLHEWLLSLLGEGERAAVAAAMREAEAELWTELGGALDPELARLAGVPDERMQRAVLTVLSRDVFYAAA
jgi:hypothetical protein